MEFNPTFDFDMTLPIQENTIFSGKSYNEFTKRYSQNVIEICSKLSTFSSIAVPANTKLTIINSNFKPVILVGLFAMFTLVACGQTANKNIQLDINNKIVSTISDGLGNELIDKSLTAFKNVRDLQSEINSLTKIIQTFESLAYVKLLCCVLVLVHPATTLDLK